MGRARRARPVIPAPVLLRASRPLARLCVVAIKRKAVRRRAADVTAVQVVVVAPTEAVAVPVWLVVAKAQALGPVPAVVRVWHPLTTSGVARLAGGDPLLRPRAEAGGRLAAARPECQGSAAVASGSLGRGPRRHDLAVRGHAHTNQTFEGDHQSDRRGPPTP